MGRLAGKAEKELLAAAKGAAELAGLLDVAEELPPPPKREPRLGLEHFQRGPPAAFLTAFVAFMLASYSPATSPLMRQMEASALSAVQPALMPIRVVTEEVRKARDASYEALTVNYDEWATRIEQVDLEGRVQHALFMAQSAGAEAANLARSRAFAAYEHAAGAVPDIDVLIAMNQAKIDDVSLFAQSTFDLTNRAKESAAAQLKHVAEIRVNPLEFDVGDWRRARRAAQIEREISDIKALIQEASTAEQLDDGYIGNTLSTSQAMPDDEVLAQQQEAEYRARVESIANFKKAYATTAKNAEEQLKAWRVASTHGLRRMQLEALIRAESGEAVLTDWKANLRAHSRIKTARSASSAPVKLISKVFPSDRVEDTQPKDWDAEADALFQNAKEAARRKYQRIIEESEATERSARHLAAQRAALEARRAAPRETFEAEEASHAAAREANALARKKVIEDWAMDMEVRLDLAAAESREQLSLFTQTKLGATTSDVVQSVQTHLERFSGHVKDNLADSDVIRRHSDRVRHADAELARARADEARAIRFEAEQIKSWQRAEARALAAAKRSLQADAQEVARAEQARAGEELARRTRLEARAAALAREEAAALAQSHLNALVSSKQMAALEKSNAARTELVGTVSEGPHVTFEKGAVPKTREDHTMLARALEQHAQDVAERLKTARVRYDTVSGGGSMDLTAYTPPAPPPSPPPVVALTSPPPPPVVPELVAPVMRDRKWQLPGKMVMPEATMSAIMAPMKKSAVSGVSADGLVEGSVAVTVVSAGSAGALLAARTGRHESAEDERKAGKGIEDEEEVENKQVPILWQLRRVRSSPTKAVEELDTQSATLNVTRTINGSVTDHTEGIGGGHEAARLAQDKVNAYAAIDAAAKIAAAQANERMTKKAHARSPTRTSFKAPTKAKRYASTDETRHGKASMTERVDTAIPESAPDQPPSNSQVQATKSKERRPVSTSRPHPDQALGTTRKPKFPTGRDASTHGKIFGKVVPKAQRKNHHVCSRRGRKNK